MNENLKNKMMRLWCLVSVISLALPLYPYYFADSPAMFGNFMTPILVVLLVLVLPLSFFTLPIFLLFKLILEIEPNDMFGAYLYLFLLNIIGYVQWLWLMPRIFGQRKQFSVPSIL